MKAQFDLPAHIAYSKSLEGEIKFNLSNSSANNITLAELTSFSLIEIEHLSLSYAPINGSEQLRQAIAEYVQFYNPQAPAISKQQVLTFCGAQEALSAIYQSILSPGDEVIVATPSYPSLVSMAKQHGGIVKEVPLSDKLSWQILFKDIQSQVTNKTKLIVLNSPHNPCGSVINAPLSGQILALAKSLGIYLLFDDVAQASNYYQHDISHQFLTYDRAISVGVLSKSLGLSGVRVGWAMTTNQDWLAELLAIKSYGSICCSVVDEALATAALQQHHKIINRNNEIILNNINLCSQFMAEYSHLFRWIMPQAGMLSLVEYLPNDHFGSDVEAFSRKLAKREGIAVLPAKLFGITGNYFRLGLGQDDLSEILNKLRAYLDSSKA